MSTFVYSTLTEREYKNYKRKIRRQREIRNKIVIFILCVLVALTFALCFRSIVSQAEDSTEVSYKYFTSLEIEQGDSLWSIAQEHINYEYYDCMQEYIDEVMDINQMQTESINVGQCIIIPYFSNIYQ